MAKSSSTSGLVRNPKKGGSNDLVDETVTDVATSFDIEKAKATARVSSLLFFDYANQTNDGKVNLSGIFDRIFVDPEDKKTLPIGVFVRTHETLDSPVRVSIISPESKVVGTFQFELARRDLKAPEDQDKKYVVMQSLIQVQFNAPLEGTYWFDVSFQGQSLGGAPLVVTYRDLKKLKEDESIK